MADLNQAKIEELMVKMTPAWKALMDDPTSPTPTAQTADAFCKYVTFVVLKAYKEAFMVHSADSETVEASVNIKLTSLGNDSYKALCTPHGWPDDRFVIFDNS